MFSIWDKNHYRANPIVRTIQIILLCMIVAGLGLIFTQNLWVPGLVNFILAREGAMYASVPLDTMGKNQARIGRGVTMSGVTLTPLEVVEDSRCPANANCVWAGTVRVRTQLESPSGSSGQISEQIFELGVPLATDTEEITLVRVDPKNTTNAILDSEYVFYFEVIKR